ncbi:filamentous hemagglutinin outer membrane protein [Kalymmatonema gypsitolerans NIES-4073]|nr:filamentous hemagglutinin outer membrane protein [Scytonema sp. NIES-4073]
MSGWHLNTWVLIGSALCVLGCTQPIAAQVVPDNTLPRTEQTQVTGNPNFQIDGGARRGGNLFHSFNQFSVPTGGSAFFNNAANIQNILTRVTGRSISNIDGLIRANGTANLFLLNPNGILFGPNASLNIGGSFVATTANAIGFPTGEVFSSEANSPLPSQLLTVNPNALFFNQLTPQPIIVQSRFNEMVFNQSSFNATGLHVPPGQNLLLVGGAIQLDSGEPFIPTSLPGRPILRFPNTGQEVQPDGGWLVSPGSYVELGAVGGVGTVGLSTASPDWQLTIPNGVPRADVSLRNGSGIYAVGASGSIRMLAQNIDISKSELLMGIKSDSRLPNTQTGDIDLNATGSITLSLSILENFLPGVGTLGSVNLSAGDRVSLDLAEVFNAVQSTGVGNAGDINITTGSLSLSNAKLYSYTNGQGNSGSVNISARDTVSFDGRYGGVYNLARSTGVGNAGDINVATGSLSLTNSATLASFTTGQGNAGSVNINARDTVSLRGRAGLLSYSIGQGNVGSVNINAYNTISLDSSTVFNVVVSGIGNVGGINITTGALSLTNGTQLFSVALGQGNTGSVNINARDRVSIDGEYSAEIISDGRSIGRIYNTSSINTRVPSGSVGQGGDVNITTGSLFLTNGGAVNTSTQEQGNAGRVTINARDSVQISGTAPTRTDYPSQVFTSVKPGALGSAGDIDITARSVSLLNGAQLAAATAGEGRAGNITVSADTVGLSSGGQVLTTTTSNSRAGDITINTPDLQLSGATSGLFAGTTSAGDAGNLTIQPRGNGQNVQVNLQEGAQISASTGGSGHGGQLTITAPESITLTGDGSIIAAGTGGSGNGGNLNLNTGTLGIQNQAQVTVSSSGTGSAGSLVVDANQIYLNNTGSIRADTNGGGGNINLRSRLILLRNGSNITTNATGNNIPGGNIGIDTRFLVAGKSEDSNISANSQDFRGGNVSINAYSIFGIQPRSQLTPLSDITATGATSALSGTLNVTTAGIDPAGGLVELQTEFVDRSQLIATGCAANEGNSFVITGRGGLPPTPEQELDDDAEWQDRRRLTVGQHAPQLPRPQTVRQRRKAEAPTTHTPNPKSYTPIIEATGWQITPTGEIILVATTPDPTVQHPLNLPVNCQGRQ